MSSARREYCFRALFSSSYKRRADDRFLVLSVKRGDDVMTLFNIKCTDAMGNEDCLSNHSPCLVYIFGLFAALGGNSAQSVNPQVN